MIKDKELELYLHIPFCVRKCDYCDFLSAPADEETKGKYVDRLIEEICIKSAAFGDREVSTLFIGGGTPSILENGRIARIMEAVRGSFHLAADAEATIEANPGTLSGEKLFEYRRAGLNRISLGLQSADDGELKRLGRIHTYEEFLESFHLARAAGFDNINVDLMSALPGQDASSWERTLGRVIGLEPEHISAYSLIVEEGTPFYERYGGSGAVLLPDEETERRMYHMTGELLSRAGYERYEISNYARPGRECRHNMGYWTGTEYLGLGLGASSYVNGYRFSNIGDMKTYLFAGKQFSYDGVEKMTEKSGMEEFMFLGLRMMSGVSEREFERRFGRSMDEVYGPVLGRMEELRLMERAETYWRLTKEGIDVSNGVLAEFLL